MKVALIFNGIPRYIELSSHYFKEKLIDENVDVFSFVWKSHEYAKMDQCYNHKILQLQEPIDFFSKRIPTRNNMYSHWYGLSSGCNAFRNYVELNYLNYDFVVRCRTDIALKNKIDFSKLDKNNVYVSKCHWQDHFLFDDNLAVLSQENYFRIFSNLFHYYDSRKDMNFHDQIPEQEFYNYLSHIGMVDKVVRDESLDFFLTRVLT